MLNVYYNRVKANDKSLSIFENEYAKKVGNLIVYEGFKLEDNSQKLKIPQTYKQELTIKEQYISTNNNIKK